MGSGRGGERFHRWRIERVVDGSRVTQIREGRKRKGIGKGKELFDLLGKA